MIERKADTDHFERRSRSAEDLGYVSRLRYEDKRKQSRSPVWRCVLLAHVNSYQLDW